MSESLDWRVYNQYVGYDEERKQFTIFHLGDGHAIKVDRHFDTFFEAAFALALTRSNQFAVKAIEGKVVFLDHESKYVALFDELSTKSYIPTEEPDETNE